MKFHDYLRGPFSRNYQFLWNCHSSRFNFLIPDHMIINFLMIFWSNLCGSKKRVDPWIWSYQFSWSVNLILPFFMIHWSSSWRFFDPISKFTWSYDPEYNKKMNPVPLWAYMYMSGILSFLRVWKTKDWGSFRRKSQPILLLIYILYDDFLKVWSNYSKC